MRVSGRLAGPLVSTHSAVLWFSNIFLHGACLLMKIIIQNINTEIYLVLTYEICFLKLKIKYHHCRWGSPLLSSPTTFSRNALCGPLQMPLRVSTGPGAVCSKAYLVLKSAAFTAMEMASNKFPPHSSS